MWRLSFCIWIVLVWAVVVVDVSGAHAAPCCSAGSALPALVTGDDAAQVSISSAMSSAVMDAPERGVPVLRSSQSADSSWSTRISGALKFAEGWQAGLGLNLIRRTTQSSGREWSASGLGDSDLSGAYEVMPEWSYSLWRPRGWLYLQVVLPTGQAIQDPRLPSPAEVRGQGVFQSALGLALTKSWGKWDVMWVPELRRLYSRDFGESGTHLGGAWAAAFQVGAGYTFASIRAGLRTQPVLQGARSVTAQGVQSIAPSKLVWNTSLELSAPLGTEWLLALAYSDQTLFGPARNTTLERGAGFNLTRRWEP